ncbi:hypothetical protein FACS189472_03100 [Alphaproteobacteria bacterium]|nr:hypothetical protein FACS189472_03100 [Alphaproteobacteria bacterium]
MGAINVAPKIKAKSVNIINADVHSVVTKYVSRQIMDDNRNALINTGTLFPLYRPSSFRNAMIDPEKVTAPMADPSPISTRLDWNTPPSPTISNNSGAKQVEKATNTAASPTRLWKPATIWGRSVMETLVAMQAPIPPPMAIAISVLSVWNAPEIPTEM